MEWWKQYIELKNAGRLHEAINFLEEVKNTDNTWTREFIIIEEIRLLQEIEDPEILNKINQYIKEFPDNHDLYEIKANIVHDDYINAYYEGSISIEVLLNALVKSKELIDEAEDKFNLKTWQVLSDNSTRPNNDWYHTTQEKKSGFVEKRSRLEKEIVNFELRRDMSNVIETLETKINSYENDKIKQFEQLTLVAAVIALIITNAQGFSKLSFEKLIALNVSLTTSLIVLITLGNFILDIGKYPKVLDNWKPIIILLIPILLIITNYLLMK